MKVLTVWDRFALKRGIRDWRNIRESERHRQPKTFYHAENEEIKRELNMGIREIDMSTSFSPKRPNILVSYSCTEGTIMVWDIDKGENQQPIIFSCPGVWEIVFNPERPNILVSSSEEEGTIKILDIDTGQELKTFSHPRIRKIVFQPKAPIQEEIAREAQEERLQFLFERMKRGVEEGKITAFPSLLQE